MLRLAAICALLSAPLAGLARPEGPGVPPDLARRVTERALARGMSAEAALAPVSDAARRDLPQALVAAKILEGLAKGVEPARVVEVAEALVARLADAADLIDAAHAAGLGKPRDRAAAIADLAGARHAGVTRSAVIQLIRAAAAAPRDGSQAVIAAAHALGELARRGVPVDDSLPLGKALARRGGQAAPGLVAQFDAWRAEGGQAPRRFLEEVATRLDKGLGLEGMVDYFGESPDRLHHVVEAERSEGQPHPEKAKGLGPAERPDAAKGAVPGLDDAVRAGRGRKKDGP
jgi:hypothetical protein